LQYAYLNVTKYSPNDQFLIGDDFVSCPSGWSGLNGRCFKYFDGPLSQANAELDCKTRNATLAYANSNETKKQKKNFF
jgi:hypothetical protein